MTKIGGALSQRDRPPTANGQQAPTQLPQNDEANWTTLVLALMMALVAAMGSPSEELLQDTLKSILVVFGALVAAFVFLWRQRELRGSILWHPVLLLPVLLCVYSLASVAWSHSYLAGAEAIRWFVLAVLLWVGMNALRVENISRLVLGVHAGITIASLWTALQFWFDFRLFPQGAIPSSTFVNRNFFAEYSVSVLPFSLYLFVKAKGRIQHYVLAGTIAFNVVALFMSGTRSALITWVVLFPILIFALYQKRQALELCRWSATHRIRLALFVIAVTTGLGSIPAGNAKLLSEFGEQTPIKRALGRATSITKTSEYTDGSFAMRASMWRATASMIQANPWLGVGAGAWEVEIPLYQRTDTQLETDYYAHNELLQLLAEYGLAGWLFALGLIGYLVKSLRKTAQVWQGKADESLILRIVCITSLLSLLIVSNAGFPFRLAATGALLAINLAILASLEFHDSSGSDRAFQRSAYGANANGALIFLFASSLVIATYITTLAVKCESSLVRSVKLALTISQSGRPNDRLWDGKKAEMLALIREGIAINPHYRKLTPMVADEMATWGDWKNAVWIWESIFQSRPHVVALSANIARGYLQLGDINAAKRYLDIAAKTQPESPAVLSLEVMLLMRSENYPEAAKIVKALLSRDVFDYDLVYSAYLIGTRSNDWPLAARALELRIRNWPGEAMDAWLKLGEIYYTTTMKDLEKSLYCYQMALDSAEPVLKDMVRTRIPAEFQVKMR